MEKRSHVDMQRIHEIEKGEHFEYKDVASHNLPISKHPEDGALFNKEVEAGIYKDVIIINENADQVRYKKI
jgi:hypothetical protein